MAIGWSLEKFHSEVMQYLGFVSGSSSSITAQIQQRILQAQPILESFGNAVTMRRPLRMGNFSTSGMGKTWVFTWLNIKDTWEKIWKNEHPQATGCFDILPGFYLPSRGRNNNSSRFGKYNRIFFDETGTLVDAGANHLYDGGLWASTGRWKNGLGHFFCWFWVSRLSLAQYQS